MRRYSSRSSLSDKASRKLPEPELSGLPSELIAPDRVVDDMPSVVPAHARMVGRRAFEGEELRVRDDRVLRSRLEEQVGVGAPDPVESHGRAAAADDPGRFRP